VASVRREDLAPAYRAKHAAELAPARSQRRSAVTKAAKVGDGASDGETILRRQIRAVGLPAAEAQHAFAKNIGRGWRFDGAWPDLFVAYEVDGGSWSNGRHVRGLGFAEDCLKLSTAAAIGWRVLRFTTEQVEDGTAIRLLEQALTKGKPLPPKCSRTAG
jgi:very-short-patch-repair endonuclease